MLKSIYSQNFFSSREYLYELFKVGRGAIACIDIKIFSCVFFLKFKIFDNSFDIFGQHIVDLVQDDDEKVNVAGRYTSKKSHWKNLSELLKKYMDMVWA